MFGKFLICQFWPVEITASDADATNTKLPALFVGYFLE
jgi:hypothetical protein